QDFQDPQVALDIVRRNPDTGKLTMPVLGDLRPISIKLEQQQPEESPANLGGTERRLTGTLTAWAQDVTVDGDIVVQPGERFTWQWQACRIEDARPERLGVVRFLFTLLEGN